MSFFVLFVHEHQYLLRNEEVNGNFLELMSGPSVRAKHMILCAGIRTICRPFVSSVPLGGSERQAKQSPVDASARQRESPALFV